MQTSIKMCSFQHVSIVPAVQSPRYVHQGDQSIPDVSKRLITALSSKLKFRRPKPIPPREFSDETKNQETSKTLATSHRPRH